MKLSVVIITKNEEQNIQRCLESLKFCDEIIVVDANSTDQTVEIAKRFTQNVFCRKWEGYASQRNYGVELTHNEWVLSIDADEVVSDVLKNEITEILSGENKETSYFIPRKTINFGRWIRHGGWYPNKTLRLFQKSEGAWKGNEIHETWETKGKTGDLRSDILHYSFDGLFDQVNRNNQYSTLGALKLQKNRNIFSSFKLILKPIFKFIETYFLKRGFLDGYPGFIISVSAAYSVFLKWAKLWELDNAKQKM